jgi:hypothetical protein
MFIVSSVRHDFIAVHKVKTTSATPYTTFKRDNVADIAGAYM